LFGLLKDLAGGPQGDSRLRGKNVG